MTQQTLWTRHPDKYGRRAQRLTVDGQVIGVVVKLPAGATAAYLANDWTAADRNHAVTYTETLRGAKAVIEAVAAAKAR